MTATLIGYARCSTDKQDLASQQAALERLGVAPEGPVAKFWRLPCVEHTGRMGASEPEVADDPERPCREVEASGQRRLQGPPLRSDADPAGGLLVPALPAQLS